MRRLVFVLIPVLTLVTLAAPSHAGLLGIHPGFKAGLTVSNFDANVSSAQDLESRSKMTFGGSLRLDVAKVFSIQPELVYVPGGGKGSFTVDNSGTPTTVDGVLKMDYLQLPLLAKFRFPGASSLVPNFYLAPSAAINLASKLQADLSSVGGSADETDVKDQMEKLLFGGAVGGGFDMGMGKGTLSLDARYSRSLSDLFKSASSGGGASSVFDPSDSKNSNLSLTLGYTF